MLFPLGLTLGLFGASVWVLQWAGAGFAPTTASHAGLMIQGFAFSFVAGFLLTMVPGLAGAPQPGRPMQFVLAALITASAVGFWTRRYLLGEVAFTLAAMLLLGILVQIYLRRQRRHAFFITIYIGVLSGVLGGALRVAVLSGWADGALSLLGRRMISEGMVLLIVLGVAMRLGRAFVGHPPQRGGGPRAWMHLGLSLSIVGSLVVEYVAGVEAAAWVRGVAAFVVASMVVPLWRRPPRAGVVSWVVWSSLWFMASGLLVGALVPEHRVDALHVVFIGGFSLLILGIATRVTRAHCGLPLEWETRHLALRISAWSIAIAVLVRVGARYSSETTMAHLGLAAVLWILGGLVWGAVVIPRVVRSS